MTTAHLHGINPADIKHVCIKAQALDGIAYINKLHDAGLKHTMSMCSQCAFHDVTDQLRSSTISNVCTSS
jgi:hypothetical protein